MFTCKAIIVMTCAIFVGGVGSAAAQTTGSVEKTTNTAAKKPNIIMIFTDDMGYADVSSFAKNKLKVKTPNIDRISEQGMKFTEFYVAMPICSPSRASVLSGRFAPETGLTSYLQMRKGNNNSDQNDFMDPKMSHMPQVFQSTGYVTAHVGKWHLGGGRDVLNAPSIKEYGYDEAYGTWEGPKENRDPKLGTNHAPWDKKKDPEQVDRWDRTKHMVDRTLDFMKRNKDKPTFVTLWPDDLHTPFWPTPEMLEKYNGKEYGFGEIENFWGVLEEYDRQIGRLLDGLKEMGIEDSTILFHTGDNGPAPHYDRLRNDGMRGMKLTLYEAGIRQPIAIQWTGKIPAGTENTETLLNAVDLLPTLAGLAGVEVPADVKSKLDGEDLSKAMLGESVKRSEPMMWEYGRTQQVPRPKDKEFISPELGIREGDFKLLVNRDGTGHELYNVVEDRNETKNIADEHPEMVKELSAKVIEWSKTLPSRTHPYSEEESESTE